MVLSAREMALRTIQLLARKKVISQHGGVIQGLPEYLFCACKDSPSNLIGRNVRVHPNLCAMSRVGDDQQSCSHVAGSFMHALNAEPSCFRRVFESPAIVGYGNDSVQNGPFDALSCQTLSRRRRTEVLPMPNRLAISDFESFSLR